MNRLAKQQYRQEFQNEHIGVSQFLYGAGKY